MKKTEMLVGNFGKKPKRYQDPALWAWLEIFSLLRGTNSISCHIFSSYNLKGAAKASAVELRLTP